MIFYLIMSVAVCGFVLGVAVGGGVVKGVGTIVTAALIGAAWPLYFSWMLYELVKKGRR